jgi:hypothetical protein
MIHNNQIPINSIGKMIHEELRKRQNALGVQKMTNHEEGRELTRLGNLYDKKQGQQKLKNKAKKLYNEVFKPTKTKKVKTNKVDKI